MLVSSISSPYPSKNRPKMRVLWDFVAFVFFFRLPCNVKVFSFDKILKNDKYTHKLTIKCKVIFGHATLLFVPKYCVTLRHLPPRREKLVIAVIRNFNKLITPLLTFWLKQRKQIWNKSGFHATLLFPLIFLSFNSPFCLL